MNKVILIGRVGKDPEYKKFDSGNEVVKFSLATSEKYKDRDGKTQEQTEWHNIVAWGKTAEIINKYIKKGSQLMVEGKIKSRSWQKDNGETGYALDIVLEKMEMLGSKPTNSNEFAQNDFPADNGADDLPF